MPLFAIFCVVAAGALITRTHASEWQTGRVTNYGDPTTGDWATPHWGSCGFGSLYEKVDEVHAMAISDTHPDFHNSCGKCFEVKCEPMNYHDRYGNLHHREAGVCYDPNKVMLFTVVDKCPCDSNHQWCCGDMPHFDLSFKGFEQLAARHWGTIGIKYREVPCPYFVQLPFGTPHN